MSQLYVFLRTNEAWDFFLIKNQWRWGLYFLSRRMHLKHLCLQLAMGAEPAHNGFKPSVCIGKRIFTWPMALKAFAGMPKLVALKLFRREEKGGGCVFKTWQFFPVKCSKWCMKGLISSACGHSAPWNLLKRLPEDVAEIGWTSSESFSLDLQPFFQLGCRNCCYWGYPMGLCMSRDENELFTLTLLKNAKQCDTETSSTISVCFPTLRNFYYFPGIILLQF